MKFLFLFLMLISQQISAEWRVGGSLGRVNLNTTIATTEGIEDRAITYGVLGDKLLFNEKFIVSLGIAMLEYDDNEGFKEYVRTRDTTNNNYPLYCRI